VLAVIAVTLVGSGCGTSERKPGPRPLWITFEYRRSEGPPPLPPAAYQPDGMLSLKRGRAFDRAAQLVPLPLPRPIERVPCVPTILFISASDGSKRNYTPCSVPRQLKPLVHMLCDLVTSRVDYPAKTCPQRFPTWSAATTVWGR
jgi:hypothetical protein